MVIQSTVDTREEALFDSELSCFLNSEFSQPKTVHMPLRYDSFPLE